MQKPKNYENTPAAGDFEPVELGGHKMIIKLVEETKSRTGKDMIKVYLDFAEDDRQPGYFANQYENDIRSNKKWPNQATQYILVNDNNGNCSRAFKTFTTCAEHSNEGLVIQWGDSFCHCLRNKKIGGVFGEQMDYYKKEGEEQGKELKKRVLRWFCSLDKVLEADIPDANETKAYKEYKQSNIVPNYGVPDNDGFMSIPDGIDEELPFN